MNVFLFFLIVYCVFLIIYTISWVILIKEEILKEIGGISAGCIIAAMLIAGVATIIMIYYSLSFLIFGEFYIPWH